MTTDAEYRDWLLDTRRDDHRLMLFHMHHSTGTIRLATKPWQSEVYESYDDWVTGEPVIDEDLDNFAAIGDLDAINADQSVLDWRTLNFRGYRSEWLHGDDEWPMADFRQIATTIQEGCRVVDGKQMRFDLMDGGQQLNRTFVTGADMTSTISAPSTIELIMTACGLPPIVVFSNVSAGESAFMVNVTYNEDKIAAVAIKELSDTMGAFTRFSQTGQLEVFIPEITENPVMITDDDIAYGSIRMVDIVSAYKSVKAKLYDGTEVSVPTTAVTGELNEEIVFDTVLRVTAHATAFANKKALYYATQHIVWELAVFDVAGLLQKGVDVSIINEEVTGEGIVTRIRRSPLSPYTLIEVTI